MYGMGMLLRLATRQNWASNLVPTKLTFRGHLPTWARNTSVIYPSTVQAFFATSTTFEQPVTSRRHQLCQPLDRLHDMVNRDAPYTRNSPLCIIHSTSVSSVRKDPDPYCGTLRTDTLTISNSIRESTFGMSQTVNTRTLPMSPSIQRRTRSRRKYLLECYM